MFDLITGTAERPIRGRSPISKAVALALHVTLVVGLVGLTLTPAVGVLPTAPTIMAFVVESPVPPPAPPPPPTTRAVSRAVEAPATPAPSVESPPVATLPAARPEPDTSHTSTVAGVEGGVEGGVSSGLIGGVVGGLLSSAPPQPPAPTAPAPVQIGGLIRAPALKNRVEPVYPGAASVAQVTGLVILEAIVDATGCVESVKVLRSRHPLLDHAAIDALKQWRYTPLVLDGVPLSFVLTVTFNFSIQGQTHG